MNAGGRHENVCSSFECGVACGMRIRRVRSRQRVRSNLTLPPGVSGNPEGEFFVTQTPQGRVFSVRLARSRDDRALDDAIERIIRKLDPLPLPNSGEAEHELLLCFRPLE